MIGLDTNVLVRYIAQDDPVQSPLATRLIESLSVEAPGFVSVVTLVELVWVLAGCYAAGKEEQCSVLETLLRTKEIHIAEAETAWKALRLFKDSKAGFADCFVECAGRSAGCEYTATFDRAAARDCGMRLLG